MKLPIAVRPLANREPGRLHLSLQGLDAEPGWAERLERDLAALPGLHRICASLPNCSLWLRFDPKRWDAVGIVQAIGRVLGRRILTVVSGYELSDGVATEVFVLAP